MLPLGRSGNDLSELEESNRWTGRVEEFGWYVMCVFWSMAVVEVDALWCLCFVGRVYEPVCEPSEIPYSSFVGLRICLEDICAENMGE